MSCCLICHHENIKKFSSFSEFTRVTSDCKPFSKGGDLAICLHCGQIQKPLTSKMQAELRQIYQNYNSYYQSDGEEQKSWSELTQTLSPRSEIIACMLKNLDLLQTKGKFLDIGCGVGVTLNQFQTFFPRWQLYGAEYNDGNKKILNKISHFNTLFTGDLTEIEDSFDCISLIHSLEHMESPLTVLRNVYNLCSENGIILIQVPDFSENRYDILVADHLFHFTSEQLVSLTEKIGFEVVYISQHLVKKELTLVAKKISSSTRQHLTKDDSSNVKEGLELVESTLTFLSHHENLLKQEVEQYNNLVVFGTSIASVWITSQFESYITNYLDEDKARVGKTFFSKNILHPQQEVFKRVFFPFSRDIGQAIADRYPNNIQCAIFPD